MDSFNELLRVNAMQQEQRLSQFIGGGGSFPYNKEMRFLNDSPRSAAAALMMGKEFQRFGRCRFDRSDFSAMGFGVSEQSARQIYLTYPSNSTFTEEDVANYFNTFGPVEDVRIPFQKERMFAFVAFVHPETAKMVLAKGNPHFVCDSRVLAKPYKEKGKILEKRQHQFQIERRDSLESYDLPVGPRLLLNNQETMRRKLELQGRRGMNLQPMLMKNHHFANQFHPHGNLISPVESQFERDHSFLLPSENGQQISQDASNVLVEDGSLTAADDKQHNELLGVDEVCDIGNTDANVNNEVVFNLKNDDLHQSLEHVLPENLFSSPTKSAAEKNGLVFSAALSEAESSSSVAAVSSSGPLQE